MTKTASSPVGKAPQGPTVERRIRGIRARAEHPQGYRLFDYRPDLLVLAGCLETVLRIHRPRGGEVVTAGGVGVACRVCLQTWPCPTVDAIVGSLSTENV